MLHCGSSPACTIAQSPSTCIIGRVRSQSTSSLRSGASSTSSNVSSFARAFESLVLRNEVQVVVAEYRDRARPEAANEAQHFERFRPAVDQVAHEPEPVRVLSEADLVQERLQLVEAALHVADRISRHRKT